MLLFLQCMWIFNSEFWDKIQSDHLHFSIEDNFENILDAFRGKTLIQESVEDELESHAGPICTNGPMSRHEVRIIIILH